MRPGSARAMLRSCVLIAAALAITSVYRALDLASGSWALVSLMLVSHTQAKASVHLAMMRVAANVVGATVALVILQVDGSTIPAILIAMLIAGLICYLAYLDDGLRSAYISVIIVMAADKFAALTPPMERIVSVTVGSLIGVGVSLIVEVMERKWFPADGRT